MLHEATHRTTSGNDALVKHSFPGYMQDSFVFSSTEESQPVGLDAWTSSWVDDECGCVVLEGWLVHIDLGCYQFTAFIQAAEPQPSQYKRQDRWLTDGLSMMFVCVCERESESVCVCV